MGYLALVRTGHIPDRLSRGQGAEIDVAEVGHTIIVRCRVVFICNTCREELMRMVGAWVGTAWRQARTRRRVMLRPLGC